MLKAAIAVLLAWNVAGVESASDEPPAPRVDHAHGPVIKSAKRLRKPRVTPASMEESEPAASAEGSSKETAQPPKPTDAWKTRKPIANSRVKSAAAAEAKARDGDSSDKNKADAEAGDVESAHEDAGEESAPGTLPEDVESTAIESVMEEDADDEDETATEPPVEATGEDSSASKDDEPSTNSDEPAAEEPAATPTAPPKNTDPAAPPGNLVPAKPLKNSQPAIKGTAPPKAAASDTLKPDRTEPAAGNPTPSQPTPIKPPAAGPRDPSPSSVAPAIGPQTQRLRDRLRKALAFYYQRPVNARDNTPWETFHWVIAYNVYAEILADGPWGKPTNAVGWLCYNRPCHGQYLLSLDQGRVKAQYGVGLQGHEGQFLAILAQSRVMIDYPLRVNNREFKVSDLVRSEMLGCKTGTELTFKLIALSHYLELNSTWKSLDGDSWDIPRLIREELSKPIQGAACGGTHRLMALSYAVRMRRLRGEPIDGEYRRAEAYVKDYHRYAFSLQNPDGSFSTNWLAGREARTDIDRRVQTTGHILEWLVFSLADAELKDPRVVKCVKYLSDILLHEPSREWKIGPLGHSLRALTLYDRRVFEPMDAPATESMEDLVEMDAATPASPSAQKKGKQPPIHSAAKPRVTTTKPNADGAIEVTPEAAPADSTTEVKSDPPAAELTPKTENAADVPAMDEASEQAGEADEEAPDDDQAEPAEAMEADAEDVEETDTDATEEPLSSSESTNDEEDGSATVQKAVRPPKK